MADSRYETDIVRILRDNVNGAECKVGPDNDGLGLVQIATLGGELLFEPEQAVLVADAIKACATELMELA
jgi:hypothetical protein